MKLTKFEAHLYANCIRDYMLNDKYNNIKLEHINYYITNNDKLTILFYLENVIKESHIINGVLIEANILDKIPDSMSALQSMASSAGEKGKEMLIKGKTYLTSIIEFIKSLITKGVAMINKLYQKAISKAADAKDKLAPLMNNFQTNVKNVMSNLSLDKFSISNIKMVLKGLFGSMKAFFAKGLTSAGLGAQAAIGSQLLAILSMAVMGILALKSITILKKLLPILRKIVGWLLKLVSMPFTLAGRLIIGVKNLILKILGRKPQTG